MNTENEADIAYQQHDHQHCVQSALLTAQHLCEKKGVKLTPLRRQVLSLIWQSHRPLGAYTLMEMLANSSERRIAPPTVYRTLDFLQQQGLVHRIASLNAFFGCCSPMQHHDSYFFICRQCEVTVEMNHKGVSSAIEQAAVEARFAVEKETVEVVGLCPNCCQSAESGIAR